MVSLRVSIGRELFPSGRMTKKFAHFIHRRVAIL
jgi:hypothetical protein